MSALDSAMTVLKSFIDAEGDQSVNEIADRLGLNKSNVSKILRSLRETGMVEQNPQTRRYSVGVEAFELGTRYIRRSRAAHEALPIMRLLVETCGHSVTLSTLRDTYALHIMAVEGPHYVDGRWRVGNRLPIHATSAGHVLLAWMPLEQRAAFLDGLELKRFSERTITRREDLEVRLDVVRVTGCSVTRGESAPGLAAIAVPVFDEKSQVLLTLGFVVPDPLFENEQTDRLRDHLFEASRSLSLKLGASDYPFGRSLSVSA